MGITPQHIQGRLDILQAEFEKGRANLEARHGAILDCQFWLEEARKEPPVVTDPPADLTTPSV